MADIGTKARVEPPVEKISDDELDARADAEIEAGKGVPHERVREWLLRLSKGERGQPPSA